MSEVMREMPRYECHKQVWALKISAVLDNKSTIPILAFEDAGYAPISVDWDWYYKHKPLPGGYYVIYADGYKSYSPAEAFEGGYTRVGTANPTVLTGAEKSGITCRARDESPPCGTDFTADEVNEVIDAALRRGTRLIPVEAIEQMRTVLLRHQSNLDRSVDMQPTKGDGGVA